MVSSVEVSASQWASHSGVENTPVMTATPNVLNVAPRRARKLTRASEPGTGDGSGNGTFSASREYAVVAQGRPSDVDAMEVILGRRGDFGPNPKSYLPKSYSTQKLLHWQP